MPRTRRFDWDNLALRVVSGLVLAAVALDLVWFDPFRAGWLMLTSVAVALLSYEWARMARADAPAVRVALAMAVAVLAVVFLTYARSHRLGGRWRSAVGCAGGRGRFAGRDRTPRRRGLRRALHRAAAWR